MYFFIYVRSVVVVVFNVIARLEAVGKLIYSTYFARASVAFPHYLQ